MSIIATNVLLAVLEGSLRNQAEFLDYSEHSIKQAFYPKKSHDVFNNKKKAYVHGVKRHNEPVIYEPDVYTWELAMEEHRRKMAKMFPKKLPNPVEMKPVVVEPPVVVPLIPAQRLISPKVNKNKVVYPAILSPQGYPIDPYSPMNNPTIRRKLRKQLRQINKMYEGRYVPAYVPALPYGNSGDSCDVNY